MPDSDPLLRDRLVAVEVRQHEHEKRDEAVWQETKSSFAELKTMMRDNRDELGGEFRDMRISQAADYERMRITQAADNERLTVQIQSLRDSRSAQSGAVGVLQTISSFLGGGGVLALAIAHALGWK